MHAYVVCMYVCVYMYACMYACISIHVCMRVHVCVYVWNHSKRVSKKGEEWAPEKACGHEHKASEHIRQLVSSNECLAGHRSRTAARGCSRRRSGPAPLLVERSSEPSC